MCASWVHEGISPFGTEIASKRLGGCSWGQRPSSAYAESPMKNGEPMRERSIAGQTVAVLSPCASRHTTRSPAALLRYSQPSFVTDSFTGISPKPKTLTIAFGMAAQLPVEGLSEFLCVRLVEPSAIS